MFYRSKDNTFRHFRKNKCKKTTISMDKLNTTSCSINRCVRVSNNLKKSILYIIYFNNNKIIINKIIVKLRKIILPNVSSENNQNADRVSFGDHNWFSLRKYKSWERKRTSIALLEWQTCYEKWLQKYYHNIRIYMTESNDIACHREICYALS